MSLEKQTNNWKLHILGKSSFLGKLDSVTHLLWWIHAGCWRRGTGGKDMPLASGRDSATAGDIWEGERGCCMSYSE